MCDILNRKNLTFHNLFYKFYSKERTFISMKEAENEDGEVKSDNK